MQTKTNRVARQKVSPLGRGPSFPEVAKAPTGKFTPRIKESHQKPFLASKLAPLKGINKIVSLVSMGQEALRSASSLWCLNRVIEFTENFQ